MSSLWTERSLELERMDVETLDAEATTRILGALETINAWIGGVSATLHHVRRFSRTWKPGERIRFIDWGTGGADIPRALVRWGRANGYPIEVTGVDSSLPTLDYARRACRDYPEITLVAGDILAPGSRLQTLGCSVAYSLEPGAPFDYALSSLTLHHLTDFQIIALLQQSDRLCRRGMIMNDLKRSARAWLWIWALTRISGAHPIVQNDGPLSVRRAFRTEELQTLAAQAGLSYLKVKTHFGYRLTLAGEKADAETQGRGDAEERHDFSPSPRPRVSASARHDVAVIGAGPAGSAAAIRLAQLGMNVRLYEKSQFPRRKLCGGFLSAECLQDLDQLGVLDEVHRAGAISIRRTLISAPWAGYTEAQLPSPGLSLSRETLDLLLLRRARETGVDVHTGTEAPPHDLGTLLTTDKLCHMSATSPSPRSWTVFAAGRKADVGGDYGIQACFNNVEGLSDQVELHLLPGGYAGLVRQDKNRVNLCALTAHSVMRRHGPAPDQILRHWMDQNPLLRQRLLGSKRLTSWQAVGPVRMGLRQLSSPRRLFAGDAACVVDPFVGEGITMSLRTARLIAQAFQQNAEPVETAYERTWHAEFDASLRWHRSLRPLLRHSLIQDLCVAGLKLFPSRLTWLTERTRTKLYAN